MTRVLLAFDKFKDSLTALAACEAAATVLRGRYPDWELDLAPLADGGEGFAEILTAAAQGRWQRVAVTGPRGASTGAGFGLVRLGSIPLAARKQLGLMDGISRDANVAVIEMALASGLALLPDDARDPWQTTTLGTGELLEHATASGAVAILLGVGGSATNDLGLGALAHLGLQFETADGFFVSPPIPVQWPNISRISGAVPNGFPPVYIACDVTNPLLGPRGAATVYGPQKGLKPQDHAALERESDRLAQMLCRHTGQSLDLMTASGTGAAGGISFGLMAACGAKLLPGFDLVSAWLDIERKLSAADLVITGEGRFDESSLEGKGPGAVAARALALGKSVHVFAGQVTAAARHGLSLHAITPPGTPLAQALIEAESNLRSAVLRAASAPSFL